MAEAVRRLLARCDDEPAGFEYRGLRFDQRSFHVFAGLCAVDDRETAAAAFRALGQAGLSTARMGAYKPRTSPYDFQGLGASCLPWVFELAGQHGVRVVAMEVLHERHLDEIREALRRSGDPTGVMLQIGTRNAQNFELLRCVGAQSEFPVLYKRGLALTLDESLLACEHIAAAGNSRVVFCLRGLRSDAASPHRNLVDFAHVPVVKRMSVMPVCVDPSHAVGGNERGVDGIGEVAQAAAQGVIAGANMVLVDVHPWPERARCDGPQALTLEALPALLEDLRIVREAYEARRRRGA